MRAWLIVALLILCAAPTAQAQDRTFRASLVAAVAAHGMDLATSMDLIGQSRAVERMGQPRRYREMNPYLGHASENPLVFGLVKMGTAAGSLWLTAKIHDAGHRKIAIVMNVAQTVALSAVAAHNYRIGRDQ